MPARPAWCVSRWNTDAVTQGALGRETTTRIPTALPRVAPGRHVGEHRR